MSFTVNTNVGAMAALQTLSATNRDFAVTQSRINTGLNVASTKDDSAAFAIAQTLRGDLSGLGAVSSSLSRAKSTTDVAVAGAEQISTLINKMRDIARTASDAGVDETSRAAYAADFTALKDQISTIVNSSEFNGTNLLKADSGAVSALQSTDTSADALTVENQDFDTNVLDAIGDVFEDADTALAMVDTLDEVAASVSTSLSTLGSASRKIDGQAAFISKLSDVIEAGIGNLVNADLAKESAKLQSLQVKQQLGIQALSIANQAPQSILSLFR